MELTLTTKLTLAILLITNITAFVAYGIDKGLAKAHKWRISEVTLLLLALPGSAPGAYAAMRLFHHKTRHVKFALGVPIIFILELAAYIWRVWY